MSGGKIGSLGHGLNAGDANRRAVMFSLSVTVTFIVTVATERGRDRVMGLPADRPELRLNAGEANCRAVIMMVSLSVTVTFIVTVATDRDRDRVMGLPADRPELSL